MKWQFEKFKDDIAIYAVCPKCGFYHSPSTLNRDMTVTITHQYKFCPMCAEYLYVEGDAIEVIVNQRYEYEEVYNIGTITDGKTRWYGVYSGKHKG